jgi:hypothetical protein
MEIQFLSEDGETYTGWKALAQFDRWGLIDVESLNARQREYLVTELTPYAAIVAVKRGDELVEMMPTLNETTENALAYFAVVNLPRLRPAPDHLAMAECEAATFLAQRLGAFHGLHRTFVTGSDENWRTVKLKRGEKTECERLSDLFVLDLVPRLSQLWHAVRLLLFAERGRERMKVSDARAVMETGIAVGESRKALSIRAVAFGNQSAGGKAKAEMQLPADDARNQWITSTYKGMSPSQSPHRRFERIEVELARHPKCQPQPDSTKTEWKLIKKRRIRDIVESAS